MWRLSYLLPVFILFFSCQRQENIPVLSNAPFLRMETTWADSLLQQMATEEKIGQLLVLNTNLQKEGVKDSLYQWVIKGQMGGLLLQDIPIDSFLAIKENSEGLSPYPLFIGTSEKLLLHNQFSDVPHFPLPATITALDSDSLKQKIYDSYLKQCQLLGINFTFAPNLYPLIDDTGTFRFDAFDGTPKMVHRRTLETIEKFNQNGILTFADNFSDYYPIENDTTGFLDSVLHQYHTIANHGVSGFVMNEKVFEASDLATLQPDYLSSFIKKNLAFDGLIVGKVSKDDYMGRQVQSGVDLFIVEDDIRSAIDVIQRWMMMGVWTEEILNEKVKKVLLAKNWSTQNMPPPPTIEAPQEEIPVLAAITPFTPLDNEAEDTFQVGLSAEAHLHPFEFIKELTENPIKPKRIPINVPFYFKNPSWRLLISQLYEKSIVLAQNPDRKIPFIKTYKRDFQVFEYGEHRLKSFESHFKKYAWLAAQHYSAKDKKFLCPLPVQALQKSTTIITLDGFELDTTNLDFINSINELGETSDVILINFGSPNNLPYFSKKITTIHIFECNDWTEALVAQLLFGGIAAQGKLTEGILPDFPEGAGQHTTANRLKFGIPEEVGIAPERLVGIDAIAKTAVQNGVFPGCQVLVAKDGKVIYNKAFGYHSFAKKRAVETDDIYDLASITKVASTTLASMKLHEQKKLGIYDRLNQHLEMESDASIRNIQLKDLFVHTSRLQPHMPIGKYLSFRDTFNVGCDSFFCSKPQETFSLQIADSFYFDKKYEDSIWLKIQYLPLYRRKRYKYSDVNFNILQRVVEQVSGSPLDDYVYNHFYHSLGLRKMRYNPLETIEIEQIVPTAWDVRWRQQLIHGYVHDETAALQGGVGGNAGLFSNAEDIAVLFQMLLNGGLYANIRFLQPETIETFTTAKYGNHRGLGFDKPRSSRGGNAYSGQASPKTFGHLGFTGTCVWADPDEDLIFVFLSNRIHPDVNNKKLMREHTRGRIHEVIYDALKSFEMPEL